MKKSAHGLKIDRRKSMLSNLKENNLKGTRTKGTRTKGSGYVKMRESKIRMLERKLQEQHTAAEAKELEAQIDTKKAEIENYLKGAN